MLVMLSALELLYGNSGVLEQMFVLKVICCVYGGGGGAYIYAGRIEILR
jgi:hypothetical protein